MIDKPEVLQLDDLKKSQQDVNMVCLPSISQNKHTAPNLIIGIRIKAFLIFECYFYATSRTWIEGIPYSHLSLAETYFR